MSSRFVICDIEATGLHEEKEIIEIALITYQDDKVVDVWDSLINPMLPVSEFIQDLTSISMKDLESAPKFYDVAEAIRLRLEGAVFVSHNTDFDLELLKKNFSRMGQELKLKNFCTLKIAQHEIPGLKNYNLDALCSFFSIKIKERHRALGDARATLELFKELHTLRHKQRPVIRFLPQHEKFIKDLAARPGLLKFKNEAGKVVRLEASFNMQKTARDLLEAKPANRELLLESASVFGEATGSALIAEFRKLMMEPRKFNWAIGIESVGAEKSFKIRPYKKGAPGFWFYEDYLDARKKLKTLTVSLAGDHYVYREGGKSKEEVIRHNQKIEQLSKEARFPNENLVIVGEGRTLGEKSLILIRDGHVLGYGHAEVPEEEIYERPEIYLTRRFNRHLGMDLLARHYLRILKNVRSKNEGWRSLADHAKLTP